METVPGAGGTARTPAASDALEELPVEDLPARLHCPPEKEIGAFSLGKVSAHEFLDEGGTCRLPREAWGKASPKQY